MFGDLTFINFMQNDETRYSKGFESCYSVLENLG